MYGVGMVMEDCDDENRDMEGRRWAWKRKTATVLVLFFSLFGFLYFLVRNSVSCVSLMVKLI
jgi:hypothetical protein